MMPWRRLVWALLAAAGIAAAAPLVVPSGASVYGRTLWVQAPSASAWWALSGVPTPARVYDASLAADLATSRRNLVSPGTGDMPATQPSPPTWAPAGWSFDGSNDYLDLGWVPPSGTPAILVSYRGATWKSGTRFIFGARSAADASRVQIGYIDTARQYHYGAVGVTAASTWPAAGVMGIGSTGTWVDGSRLYSWSRSITTGGYPLALGASNSVGTISAYMAVQVCAVVIWDSSPDDAAMAAMSAAMAARCAP